MNKTRRLVLSTALLPCLFVAQNAQAALGDFLGSVSLTNPPLSTPVGIENDGTGDLLITDIGDPAGSIYTTIDVAGSVLGPTVSLPGTNALGIAISGSSIWITDTLGTQVMEYNLSGTMVSSFSVGTETWFPEGITVEPVSGHLFVVDGTGGNMVFEYATDGTLITSYPVQGSSQDGLAYDPMTNSFWLYDSGTDTVRQYDLQFNEVSSFPGTVANSLAGGEGLAVVGGTLYIVATGSNALASFDITGAPAFADSARFNVTKSYSDGAVGDVEVTLSCNGGLPLTQSFTLPGDGSDVTFTLTNIPDGGVNCEITESGGPDGYAAELNGGNGCSWNGLAGGYFVCDIVNKPEPVDFLAWVEWDISANADPGTGSGAVLNMDCQGDSNVSISYPAGPGDLPQDGDGMPLPFVLTGVVPPSTCTAELDNLGSVVETAGNCDAVAITVGMEEGENECTITATAFFEGIPTLSEWGMALMALLMLGVGFIGFRRMV